jgi:hypothetical protein
MLLDDFCQSLENRPQLLRHAGVAHQCDTAKSDASQLVLGIDFDHSVTGALRAAINSEDAHH